MLCCTFFGHRDICEDIETRLYSILVDLIEKHGVTHFLVGHQGDFDSLVRQQLKNVQKMYPHIHYAVVLAYFPAKTDTTWCIDYSNTIIPDGLENTPPKYAINKRNQWMLDKSSFVVTYVKHPFGGAAKWEEKAKKKNLIILPLAEKAK